MSQIVQETIMKLHAHYCTPRRVILLRAIVWGGLLAAWMRVLWRA